MEKWVPCEVSEGMFPSEYTVTLDTADGEVSMFITEASYFLPAEKKLKVRVLYRAAEPVVMLPKESLEGARVVRLVGKEE